MHPSFLPGPGVPGLVSVIIPTFNRADIIRETLDSVLAQTYSNFEAIVIDDGSADRTRAVVSAYRDPRIKYSYKENGGLSSARNAGLDLARGEFIAFLDSDDVWHSWKLAAQVDAADPSNFPRPLHLSPPIHPEPWANTATLRPCASKSCCGRLLTREPANRPQATHGMGLLGRRRRCRVPATV